MPQPTLAELLWLLQLQSSPLLPKPPVRRPAPVPPGPVIQKDRGTVPFTPPSPALPGVTAPPARFGIDMLDAMARGLQTAEGSLGANLGFNPEARTLGMQKEAQAAVEQARLQATPQNPLSRAFMQAAPSIPAMAAGLVNPLSGAALMAAQSSGDPSQWGVDKKQLAKSVAAQGATEYLGMLPEYALFASNLSPVLKVPALFASNLLSNPVEEGAQGLEADYFERGKAPTLRQGVQYAEEAIPATLALSALGGAAGMLNAAPRETKAWRSKATQLEAPIPRSPVPKEVEAATRNVAAPAFTWSKVNGGATWNPRTGRVSAKGVAVTAYPQHGVSLPKEEFNAGVVQEFLRQKWPVLQADPKANLGIWENSQDDRVYLDLSYLMPYDDAVVQGRNSGANGGVGEYALWDNDKNETIWLAQPDDSGAWRPLSEPLRERSDGSLVRAPLDAAQAAQPELPFPSRGAVFNAQTPDWKPYKQPGTDARGVQSSQEGGHQVRVVPTREGFTIENHGSRMGRYKTLAEAQAAAEKFITSLPTPKAVAPTAPTTGTVEKDLGILVDPVTLQPPTRNMGPAATVIHPKPQPTRAPLPPMTPQEQQMAEALERASGFAQARLAPQAERRARQALREQEKAVERAQASVTGNLTELPGGLNKYGFPVWDVIKNQVSLPDTALQGFAKGYGRAPAALNELLGIAHDASMPVGVIDPLTALEPRAAIRLLKRSDPDYLNMLLSRGISAYYGDRAAGAMLQMEEAHADPNFKALLEDINMAVEGSAYNRNPPAPKVENAIDQGQQTIAPLGEMPPLLRTPPPEPRTRFDEMNERTDAQRAAGQEAFPEEVMNPRQAEFMRRMEANGQRPDPRGGWNTFTASGQLIASARTREIAERSLAEKQSRGIALDAFIAPAYIKGNMGEFNFDPNKPFASSSGFMGGQITTKTVREFWNAAQGPRSHKDKGYFDPPDARTYTQGNSEVRSTKNRIQYFLHNNLIASYDRNTGDLTLQDAGWQTKLTMNRLNALLSSIGHPQIYQKKFQWYIGDEKWDGELTIPNVRRTDTGTFAMQNPDARLPSYALNIARPEAIAEASPAQMTLPGVGPSERTVDVLGTTNPVFGQGAAALVGKRAAYPPGPVLVLTPNPELYKDPRRQSAHDLLARAMDWAEENHIGGVAVPIKFAEQFKDATQYESFHRGALAMLNPFDGGKTVILARQVDGSGWGAQPTSQSPFSSAQLPQMDAVSDDFFQQTKDKFDFTTSADLAGAEEETGRTLGHGLRPLGQAQRRQVMGLLEGLERMGLPPLLVNRLRAIGSGSYDSPGNLAQVDFARGALSMSEESLRQLARGEATPQIAQSVAHELGHLATIVVDEEGQPESYLYDSPLFDIDEARMAKYAQIGFVPPVAQDVGPVMREVLSLGMREAGMLGKMLRYPAKVSGMYKDIPRLKAEAFAQVWSAYYLYPEQMKMDMPHSYNMMKELSEYANTSKTFDQWTDRLRAGLQVGESVKPLRKELLSKEVIAPFQAAFFHSNPDVPAVQQPGATPTLEQKAGQAIAGDSTALTGWAQTLAETTKADWTLAKGGVIPASVTKNSAIDLAARVGFNADEVAKMLTEPNADPGSVARGLAMAATTSRVNLARATMAPDVETFAARLADAANMLIVARTQASEAGRALGHWGKMIAENDGAMNITEKAADAARDFLKGKETVTAKDIVKQLGGEQEADFLRASLYQASQNGTLDIDNVTSAFNAIIASAGRRQQRGEIRRYADMPLEWFRISILTGPATHQVNVMSTALNVAMAKFLVEPTAAGINLVTRAKDQPGFRDQARGILAATHSLGDVAALSKFGFLGEYPASQIGQMAGMNPYQQQAALALGEDKWRQENMPALPGGFGRVARSVGFGTLGAEDAAIKAIVLKDEIRSVMSMYGKEWDGVSRVPAEIMSEAMDRADKLTFNEKLGEKGAALNSLVRGTYVGSWVIPFTRTMTNIIKTGVSMTPGPNLLLKSEREALATPHSRAQNEALARMSIGTGLFALVAMLRSDPEDPDKTLTAPAPKNWARRNVWYLENGNLAIRTSSGEQYEIYRMEPLNIVLGSMIGAVDAMNAKDKSAPDKLAAAATAMAKTPLNAHFLGTVADMVDAFASSNENNDPLQGKRMGQWMARTGAAMTVPQFSAQGAQFLDPWQRKPEPQSYVDQVKVRLPGLRETLPQKLDVRGEPIPELRYNALLPAIPHRPPGADDPLAEQLLSWDKGLGFPRALEGKSVEEQQAILRHQWRTLREWGPYENVDEFERAKASYSRRKDTKALRGGDLTKAGTALAEPKWMQDEGEAVARPAAQMSLAERIDLAGGAAPQRDSRVTKQLERLNRGIAIPTWVKALEPEERERVLSDRWKRLEKIAPSIEKMNDRAARSVVEKTLNGWSRSWANYRRGEADGPTALKPRASATPKPKLSIEQKLDAAGGEADQRKDPVMKLMVRANRGLAVPAWTKQLDKAEREEILADRWAMLQEATAGYDENSDPDELKATINRALAKWSRRWKYRRDELRATGENAE